MAPNVGGTLQYTVKNAAKRRKKWDEQGILFHGLNDSIMRSTVVRIV